MLVLTRKAGESILIGNDVRIRVLATTGTHARIAIEAPDDVTILREEVYERIAEANRAAAAGPGPESLPPTRRIRPPRPEDEEE